MIAAKSIPQPLHRMTLHLRWTSVRWTVLGIFCLGYFETRGYFGADFSADYIFYTGVSIAACALYLSAIGDDFRNKLHVWVIFIITTVGYYLQFYWLILNELEIKADNYVVGKDLNPGTLAEAFAQTGVAYAISAVMVVATIRIRPKSYRGLHLSTRKAWYLCRGGALLATLLVASTTLLMVIFRIGVGPERVDLPFRLAGLIVNIRSTIVPAILLLVMMCSGVINSSFYYWASIGMLVSSAFADMLITTSKAPLIFVALQMFAMHVVDGTLTRARLQLIVVLVIASAALFPFMRALRVTRFEGADVFVAVDKAENISRDRRQPNELREIAFPVLERFSGTEALVPILSLHARAPAEAVSDSLLGGAGVTGFNTSLYGYNDRDLTGVAPSLLGWFYLVGGETGQLVGMVGTVLFVCFVWLVTGSSKLLTRPVIQALTIVRLLTSLSEGTLEGVPRGLFIIFVCSIALETSVRLLSSPAR